MATSYTIVTLIYFLFNHISGKIGGPQGKYMALKKRRECREHQTAHNGESDTQLKVLLAKLLEHGGWWWLMSTAISLVGGDCQQV